MPLPQKMLAKCFWLFFDNALFSRVAFFLIHPVQETKGYFAQNIYGTSRATIKAIKDFETYFDESNSFRPKFTVININWFYSV